MLLQLLNFFHQASEFDGFGGKDQSSVQAPMPLRVIEKGLCGLGLLAHVVLSNYIKHRPQYRVQQKLARHGVEIIRATLADWVDAAAAALEPIYKAIRTDLVGFNYLEFDETPVRVMDPEARGKTASGWLWVYARPKGGVLFDFQRSRGRAGPDEILKTFNGTIESDGYALYGAILRDRPRLKRLVCWAHARRKFHDV